MILKWIKYLLGFLIVGFLLWYLAVNWHDVKHLLKLDFRDIIIIYLTALIGSINSAVVVMEILRPMGIRAYFWNMFMLQNTCMLLNYVPMKLGTLFFANYLKRHYGLKFSHFGTFSVFLTLLIAAISCFMGVLVMVFVYGVADVQKQLLAIAFLIIFIASVLMIFLPLPIPKGQSKLSIFIRDFISGRSFVTKDNKALLIASFFLFLNFIVSSIRIGVIYYSMGVEIHPAGFLVLGVLGYIVLFANFTPGALGVREAVLGAGAVILGVPLEAGVTAALIDRGITLIWAFTVGGFCTCLLRFNSPADFKKENLYNK
ncbi:MAG: hypothetical protein A2Y10_16835 [Planctomycetes bacterium GWF2_41_51]|nr:MAG: hypothetical protein A2Y10_16835 [Planctomycetes bacterium GWF2_41_51]HBG28866.1 hypothetical protein [Phycisphaerales bacterium]